MLDDAVSHLAGLCSSGIRNVAAESPNGLLEWWISLGLHNLSSELAIVDKPWVDRSNLVMVRIGYPHKGGSTP